MSRFDEEMEETILGGLQKLIQHDNQRLTNAYWAQGGNPDENDAKARHAKDRIASYRRIRAELEDLFVSNPKGY